jgi:integrase/recombinase XerD
MARLCRVCCAAAAPDAEHAERVGRQLRLLRASTALEARGPAGPRCSRATSYLSDDLDIDRHHWTLRIVRKGGKQATIPLAPRTARALDVYLGERLIGPIFLGAAGGRMDRYAADRTVKRLARRAGITKRISPHSLRHSFITAALDAGVPLRDVQEAASHADPRTTMRYDRARQSLDRHATYIVAAFLAGAAR